MSEQKHAAGRVAIGLLRQGFNTLQIATLRARCRFEVHVDRAAMELEAEVYNAIGRARMAGEVV